MKSKVVYFLPDNGISGGAGVVLQHVYRLKKYGINSIVVTVNNKTDFNWFPYKVKVLPYSEYKFNTNDIIVATWWETAFLLADKKCKHRYYFVQSDESRFYKENDINKKFTILSYYLEYNHLTEAKWIKKLLKNKYGKNSLYIPNGIDINIFYRSKVIKPRNKKLRVLIEGPIDLPWKGINDAFEVVRDMDCEVWYVSSSGYPKPEWKVDKFFYKVPMHKMRYIYSSCDVLLKMSKVEGFFGPPLEMMACGGTAIVSKVTGFEEYIKDNYNALVVDIGDVKSARQKLKLLIDNRDILSKLKKNAQNTVKEHLWDKSIEILAKEYSKKIDMKTKDNISNFNKLITSIRDEYIKNNNDRIKFFTELSFIKNSRWWRIREKLKFLVNILKNL